LKGYRQLIWFFAIVWLIALCSCSDLSVDGEQSGKLSVVTTTTLLADLVSQIGGDSVTVSGLMGPGVDPHSYKATEGDVFKIIHADLVMFNGLMLEGRLDDLFRKMQQRNIHAIAVSDVLDEQHLRRINDESQLFDPHIWFSVRNWKAVATFVAEQLSLADPANRDYYMTNLSKYLAELDEVAEYIHGSIARVPPAKRVLITAHDAFGYFGDEFGFEVIGLQGISTVSEAGAADVRELANLIVKRQIPAIFVESSVSDRSIRALQEAVASRGFSVDIGGTLYSDALGASGTPQATYTGMFKHNIRTITQALTD
jgi:manganese/zinc/iron transport system substrate-binding protein